MVHQNVLFVSSMLVSSDLTVIAWKSPPRGCIKLNSDAAAHHATGKSGIGVVARNSMGHLEGAWAINCSGILDVVGASAICLVLLQDRDQVWHHIEVEFDALGVI
ncbi:hypothetical protein ACH5RR_028973 [Cinchona calisaya]|uniref:RNase H type-1 domain-containing protein n=1 Tax=Cinchona calisaya TaxID=153742 RepID=A0ABD2YTL7_9GENT